MASQDEVRQNSLILGGSKLFVRCGQAKLVSPFCAIWLVLLSTMWTSQPGSNRLCLISRLFRISKPKDADYWTLGLFNEAEVVLALFDQCIDVASQV